MATHSSICAWRIPAEGGTGTWQATVHGVSESDTTERLSTHAHIYVYIYNFFKCIFGCGESLLLLGLFSNCFEQGQL